MPTIQTDHPATPPGTGARTGRIRHIGPVGTASRVELGGYFLGSVVAGEVAHHKEPAARLLALVVFPALLLATPMATGAPVPRPPAGHRPGRARAQLRGVRRPIRHLVVRASAGLHQRRRAHLLRRLHAARRDPRLRGMRGPRGLQLAAPPRRPGRLRGLLTPRLCRTTPPSSFEYQCSPGQHHELRSHGSAPPLSNRTVIGEYSSSWECSGYYGTLKSPASLNPPG